MPRTIDADVLASALVGHQSMVTEIESRIADLRQRLGTAPKAATKHRISAAGRARIAAAQKKRWAAARRAKESGPTTERPNPKNGVDRDHEPAKHRRRASQRATSAGKKVQTRKIVPAVTAPTPSLNTAKAKKRPIRAEKSLKRQRQCLRRGSRSRQRRPTPETTPKPEAPIADTVTDQGPAVSA